MKIDRFSLALLAGCLDVDLVVNPGNGPKFFGLRRKSAVDVIRKSERYLTSANSLQRGLTAIFCSRYLCSIQTVSCTLSLRLHNAAVVLRSQCSYNFM